MTNPKPMAVVVDDDLSLGITFKFALEMSGFEVEHINDSHRAIERIRARQPQVVTLDMQMPKVSGVEILQQIRADPQLANIKVIMVTANSNAMQDETINSLADLLLLKPVSLQQIRDLVMRFTQST